MVERVRAERSDRIFDTGRNFGDIRKVALWLGHTSLQSTEVYLRADPAEKLEAIPSRVPPTVRRGHFWPPDKLLAMLRPKL